ncbi:FecR domain-containing protein [Deinococcus planocerae]|uniref:FecR domain-containing protein n=1 Tax=Deinococcus planocerae TaxID=1737569 RepID=UPI000C7F0F49|nr:FecR domain-containing protein [Deinococcus planocerae]
MRRTAAWTGLCALFAQGVLTVGLAQTASVAGAPPRGQYLSGRAEVLGPGNVWRAASGPPAVPLGLRVGTGRARITGSGGQVTGSVLLASASRLGVTRQEANLQEGNFVLDGPVAVHARGSHVVMDRPGRARVDLRGGITRRVAVISGSARVALAGRVVTVSAGQQLNLASGAITPFREDDPWYAAQFTGTGDATVQATRGTVRVVRGAESRSAGRGETLDPGERLATGEGSWAEVGFTASGGYLRLQSHSELSAIGAEGSGPGREVTLQLTRGSAWNVVPGAQSVARGSQLRTPVVSTAARGAEFRVDAGGRVRVREGDEAPPAGATGPNSVGSPASAARALTLQVDPPPGPLRELTLTARSLPDAQVTATVSGRRVALTRQGDRFRLGGLTPPLPEGTYTVRVSAERGGEAATRWQTVVIDRTAPSLTGVRAERVGRSLTLTGTARDAGTGRLTLTARVGGTTFTRQVSGDFRLLLPAPAPGTPLRVSVRDEAGNESYADLS